MSKLSNCLNMINILSEGKKYTIKELSEILEVTPKMIRIYKDELEKAGIYVNSVKGPYGGYYLNDNYINHLRGLTKEDIELLNKVTNDEIKKVIDKINMIYNNKNPKTLKDKELEIYNVISKGIKENKKIKIEYLASKGTKRERIVEPLQLLHFNKVWYLIAFCETRQGLRKFRFQGIQNIELLKEIF